MPSNTFCSNPWRNLEISADGSAGPCCAWRDKLKDENGNEFNVSQHTLEEIYNSDHLKKLRKKLLNNEKPPECGQCWEEEAVNIESIRQKTTPDSYQHSSGLKTLKMGLGNICNLRCRICGSWASSIWAKNELKMQPAEHKSGSFEFEMLQKGQWPRTSKTFWKDFYNIIPSLEEIYFYGGEPLLVPQHLDVLEKIGYSGHSKHIMINYNTNGTVFPDTKTVSIWEKFNSVAISLSLDNIFKKFEYERSKADWQKFIENLDSFYSLHTSNSNINVSILLTISVFNVLDIEEIHTWLTKHYPELKINMYYLFVEKYFCIKYLPVNIKTYIKNKLLPHQEKISEIKNIIDFMEDVNDESNHHDIREWKDFYDAIKDPSWPSCNKKEDFFNLPREIQTECKEEFGFDITESENELLFRKLKQEIKRIDLFREERLVDTHPELNSLLKIY